MQGESTLDVQMVAGLAPAASIKVYQTDGHVNDDPWTQVNDELQHILDDNTGNSNAGSVVSISFGIDEAATPGWDFPTSLGSPNLGSFDKAVSNTLA